MFRRLLPLVLAFLISACDSSRNQVSDDPRGDRPAAAVSVLVDLSETWHNQQSQELNRRVLRSVGQAINGAATSMPLPLAIRYHAIGSESLGRTPLCAATFRPSAFSIGRAEEGRITNRDEFRRYVEVDCPEMFLARPFEPATEISAAIVSASRALALVSPTAPRTFILLSDFKEEAAATPDLNGLDLSGAHVILLYRTLPEDRRSPGGQQSRLEDWQRRLTALRASVSVVDENAVLSSLPDFQALIGRANGN